MPRRTPEHPETADSRNITKTLEKQKENFEEKLKDLLAAGQERRRTDL